MNLALIPFGLKPVDGILVDVVDVDNGKNCGCICPSCKTPLIARQGMENEWHFAHASRGVYDKTKKECEYSFYLSVRMMARQIIGNELSIILPAYEDSVTQQTPLNGKKITEKFLVTESREIVLSNVQVESQFMGHTVDIVGDVAGYKFIIYFTHAGRSVPFTIEQLTGSSCGFICFSLESLRYRFSECRNEACSYHEILRNFLVSNLESKLWFFHPRYQRIYEKAARRLSKKISSIHETPKRQKLRGRIKQKRRARTKNHVFFLCSRCNIEWQGQLPGINACPNCKSTDFRSVI